MTTAAMEIEIYVKNPHDRARAIGIGKTVRATLASPDDEVWVMVQDGRGSQETLGIANGDDRDINE